MSYRSTMHRRSQDAAQCGTEVEALRRTAASTGKWHFAGAVTKNYSLSIISLGANVASVSERDRSVSGKLVFQYGFNKSVNQV